MNGISGISFQQQGSKLSVRIHKSGKNSSGKQKKRLPYSFKQMSKLIMQAKTSDTARPVVTKLRTKLSWLYKKLKSGEYGESEVFAAIIHAASMERIAKRKVRHLEEEERAEQESGSVDAAGEEEGIFGREELEASIAENDTLSEKQMKAMMEEIEKLEKELAEDSLSEMQDMAVCASGDMTEEEIEEMKRRHRSSEERQITRADLKYLKALFDRLEQEKRTASAEGFFREQESSQQSISFAVASIPEIEMPEADIPNMVDVTV